MKKFCKVVLVDGDTFLHFLCALKAVKFIFPDTEDESDPEFKQIQRECKIAAELKVVSVFRVKKEPYRLADLQNILPDSIPLSEPGLLELIDRIWRKFQISPKITGISLQMELCGENLRKWLSKQLDNQNGNLYYDQFLIIENIVAGLAHLHKTKILHRDLKPENVMFSKIGFKFPVKIGDFGLCRTLRSPESQDSTLTSRAGTLNYMAPEAFTNKYSYPADMFSLGLIIWEASQLIKVNERKSLFDRLVNDKEKGLVKVHPAIEGVRELVLSLTERKVDDRLTSIDEVTNIVEGWPRHRNLVARNGKELRNLLQITFWPGSIINLVEGLYSGEFVLWGENVTLNGLGERTIIEGSPEVLSIGGIATKFQTYSFIIPLNLARRWMIDLIV